MITNAQKLTCGNCGGEEFNLFRVGEHNDWKLISECRKCKGNGITIIISEKPRLAFEWGEGSQGILSPSI